MTDALELKRKQLVDQAQGIIFPYSEKWSKSHAEFATKMWPNKLRRRNEAYIRWKFRGPQNGEVPGFLLAVIEGKVVGQLGLIPVKLWVDGRIFDAQWACDLMVDSATRLKGIGSLLLAAGMERDMVTLGSNPSTLADISMSKLGFLSLTGPRAMILPLKIDYVLNLLGQKRIENKLMKKSIQTLLNLRNLVYRKKQTEQTLQIPTVDAIERISEHQLALTKPHIVHDSDFLNWRFSSVIPAKIHGWVSSTAGYALSESTPRTYYVYDWFSETKSEAQSLFQRLILDAVESDSQSLMAYANSSTEVNYLKSLGFISMRTPVKVIYYPHNKFTSDTQNFHYCIYDSDGNL